MSENTPEKVQMFLKIDPEARDILKKNRKSAGLRTMGEYIEARILGFCRTTKSGKKIDQTNAFVTLKMPKRTRENMESLASDFGVGVSEFVEGLIDRYHHDISVEANPDRVTLQLSKIDRERLADFADKFNVSESEIVSGLLYQFSLKT